MLKNVSPLITPELLHTLAAMGHGDRLALVDRNYPARSLHERVLPLAGVDTSTAAEAILSLFPVDDFVLPAAFRMVPDGGSDVEYDSHSELSSLLEAAEGRPVTVEAVERTPFYELARSAYAVVHTSDDRAFSCFLFTKGVL